MKAAMHIRTGSFTARLNTPLGAPRRLSQRASLTPQPGLPADVNQRTEISSPSSQSPSRVLRRASSEGRVEVSGRAEDEVEQEVEYTGGGMGNGRKVGGGRGGERQSGDRSENGRIGDYYQELLRNDPTNPLLLRNYGKFLHEIEGDVEGAKECYGRAILVSPGDGEVLSLYGNLVWEMDRDEERAGAYFERAVEASPDDCYVLGSYAHFLWDTEEDDGEEKKKRNAVS